MVTTNIVFIPDEMNFMFAEIIIEENRCSCVSLPAEVAVGADLTKGGHFVAVSLIKHQVAQRPDPQESASELSELLTHFAVKDFGLEL